MNFDAKQAASELLDAVGGAKNITTFSCCSTRVRLTLVDNSKADMDKLQKAPGVIGAFRASYSPGLDVIYGSDNARRVYDESLVQLKGSSDGKKGHRVTSDRLENMNPRYAIKAKKAGRSGAVEMGLYDECLAVCMADGSQLFIEYEDIKRIDLSIGLLADEFWVQYKDGGITNQVLLKTGSGDRETINQAIQYARGRASGKPAESPSAGHAQEATNPATSQSRGAEPAAKPRHFSDAAQEKEVTPTPSQNPNPGPSQSREAPAPKAASAPKSAHSASLTLLSADSAQPQRSDGKTLREMGDAYYEGNGVEEDWEKALWLYEQAANAGDIKANTILGRSYLYGTLSESDPAKGIAFLEVAVKAGDPEAEYELSECYRVGLGVEQDDNKSFTYCQRAAEKGYSEAQMALGMKYFYGSGVERDGKEAIRWNERAADQGNALSLAFMGDHYLYGKGVEMNGDKAYELYTKASDGGSYLGYFGQSVCREWGVGTKKDEFGAFIGYGIAADGGEKQAMYRLGRCYQWGIGTHVYPAFAIAWYRVSARVGNSGYAYDALHALGAPEPEPEQFDEEAAEASLRLGNSCLVRAAGRSNDDEAAQDYKEAAEHFTEGVRLGSVPCLYELSKLYDEGRGVSQDRLKALALLEEGAALGDSSAQVMLGKACQLGDVVDKDEPRAVTLFKKAAKQDVPLAWYELGRCYERGIGTDQDMDTALFCYRESAQGGIPTAVKALQRLGAES